MAAVAADKVGLSFYDELKEAVDVEPTYVPTDKLYLKTRIQVDWKKFRDPFQLIPEQYYRVQAEKERLLVGNYELVDRFRLWQGFDQRWLQLVRLAMVSLPSPEYAIGSAFGALALQVPGGSWRMGVMGQMFDEHRHGQNDLRNAREINKFFPGAFEMRVTQFNHLWLMQIFRNYFEDINATLERDVLEAVIGLNFTLEVALSNMIFGGLPGVSTQSKDIKTAQHFMSIQSDESRHMALGNEMLRFALENAVDHPADLEIVEYWLHKWMWRTYRALMPPVAVAADVFSNNRAESYKILFKRYVTDGAINGVLKPLQRQYYFKLPRSYDVMLKETDYYSHALWQLLYAYKKIAPILVPKVNKNDREWFREHYPNWDKDFGPWWDEVDAGDSKDEAGLPKICHVCQLPCVLPTYHNPVVHESVYKGEKLFFCSEPCKEIFETEPDVYGPVRDQGQRLGSMLQGGMSMEEFVKWLGVPKDVLEHGGLLPE